MQIKPLYDRVLVKPHKRSQNTTLIMPDEVKSEKMEVLALGKTTSGEIKPHDIVLINKYAGSEFEIDGETFILIKECDILGILKENENE